MPRSKAKAGAKAPANPLTAVEQAEEDMRQRLSDNSAPINYRTGKLEPGSKLPSVWLKARQNNCSLGSVLETPPSTNKQATIQDYYTYGHKFAAFNPCVSYELTGACRAEHQRLAAESSQQQQRSQELTRNGTRLV